jgi:short subunit dehydrogenase-like uncharacterized protein
MRRAIVFGGYGVFGSQVARALSQWGVPLAIAGHARMRAEVLARQLGGDCTALIADVNELDSCRAALAGSGTAGMVAVNCAGPFQHLGPALLEACLEMGCPYVDIADDRVYAARVRALDQRWRERSLTAVYGCSSLPGISGALALVAREGTESEVRRVRVTLVIGNRNPKGEAAIRSLLASLGQPIQAPQGLLRGFRDREVVSLPAPFGRRGVFNFESPDYDLLAPLLPTDEVSVKVAFEMRLATYGIALLAASPIGLGTRLAPVLGLVGRVLGRHGYSGGAVMTELFLADGSVQSACLYGENDGQRMAALPAALVAQELCTRDVAAKGAMTAYEFLGARRLLEMLIDAGFTLRTEARDRSSQ